MAFLQAREAQPTDEVRPIVELSGVDWALAARSGVTNWGPISGVNSPGDQLSLA